jgi:hypothetical protein
MRAGLYFAGGPLIRKSRIGASVSDGAAVMYDTGQVGEIIMCTANSAANAMGYALEAGTYAATSPGQWVRTDANPFVIVQGNAYASSASAAFSTATSDQILLQDAASTTVFTDTAVATLDYEGGYLIPLTGTAAGDIRVITTQADNTSTTVSVPFSSAIAVNAYALRTYGAGTTGIELVATDFNAFNNQLAAGEAIGDALGEFIVWDVIVDDQSCAQSSHINIKNGTSPKVEFQCMFEDHLFNSVAVS